MASRDDVAALRAANDDLVTIVKRDLNSFWRTLDLSKPEAARDALIEYLPALVSEYGDMAATISADWYDEMRVKAGVTGRFAALAADSVGADVVEAEVRYAAGALFTDAPASALSILEGATARYVLNAGRDTIVNSSKKDPKAGGWYRISGGGCDFCNMLAARGAVYKEATADFAAHDHCRCGVAPSWDPSRPEADVKQYEGSKRMDAIREKAAKGDANAQRQLRDHNARIRGYIEAHPELKPAP